ncbi:hypothetical protein CCHL11_03246 [Colletotrichum chlorophyti]|uniref:Alternative oxidase n=1 Tax=Colletotrichum chlorophyti TaxID=708187 RepID=A0A1Q8S3R6_9PEZI|nr:hypothetical protein CCHL11_03246 [Colletotrichum chlorophyti]
MGLLVRYPTARFGRYAAAAGAFIFFLVWAFRIRIEQVGPSLHVQVTPWMPTSSADDIFDFPPIESETIKAACSTTEWDTKSAMQVVFTCDHSVGGIGNIRNSILNCVRYAILAGGSLVMPRIVVRNDSDITVIRTDEVYKALGPPRTWSLGLFPESLVEEERIPGTGIEHPERWRGQLYDWLNNIDTDTAPTGKPSEGPFVVDLGRSYLTYPIYSDGESFATSFGDILKFRADTRELATATLVRMAQKFEFMIPRPADGISPPSPILEHAFFGAHLRAEKDSQDNWNPIDPMWEWSEYSKQTAAYLEQATLSNLSLIYVASGNVTQVGTFASEAKPKGITVITKQDMLAEDSSERDRLEDLAWDQQALVDFLIMLRASQFGGVAHSSFAWNIALKRHLFVKSSGSHLDGPQMLSDELSQIYGEPRKYPEYASCLWP